MEAPLPSSPHLTSTRTSSVSPFFQSVTSPGTNSANVGNGITHSSHSHIFGASTTVPESTSHSLSASHAAFAAAIAAASVASPSINNIVLPTCRSGSAQGKSSSDLTTFNRRLIATTPHRPPASSSAISSSSGGKANTLSLRLPSHRVCKVYTPEEVARLLEIADTHNSQPFVLLLDVRPMPQQRARGRLQHAVPVCVSQTLLKRSSFTVDRVGDLLASEKDRNALRQWREYQHIIVYDTSSSVLPEQSQVASLCRKFQNEPANSSVCDTSRGAPSIGWLQGGFDALAALQPSRVQDAANDVTPCELPSMTQKQIRQTALSLASSGPLTCPTPILENSSFFNSLMDSVCQGRTYYRAEPEEQVQVRLCTHSGDELNDPVQQSVLPAWLRHVYTQPNDLSHLFERIELDEQDRLRRLLVRHSRNLPPTTATCPLDQYSIQAGLQHPAANRYCNVWPFDRNRVCLSPTASLDSDYVNASRICAQPDDPSFPSYLVSQGPTPSTFAAFWWMCWSEQVGVVVMLTQEHEHGRLKCHKYWPQTVGVEEIYREVGVRLLAERRLEDGLELVERDLEMRHVPTGRHCLLRQLQYIGWPDCGVPQDLSVVPRLCERVSVIQSEHIARLQVDTSENNADRSKDRPPVVIHCSAGCGRSGVFCVIDTLISQVNVCQDNTSSSQTILEGNVDAVNKLVKLFRTQRVGMVQNFQQFIFCYEVLATYLLSRH